MSFCYSRKFRLLYSLDFQKVLSKNNKISTFYFNVYFCFNYSNASRLGIIISKKNIKCAHDRNRIKRLLRESFRNNTNKLPYMDFVIIIKNSLLSLNNSEVFKLLNVLWCNYVFFN